MAKTRDIDPDVRFLLANDRTLLAWIRTSLAIEAGGLALIQIHPRHAYVGIIILLLGALVAVIGYSRYRAADRAIRRGKLPPRGHGPALEVIMVVAVALALTVAELTFLR
jgi:putative membrane protein